MAEKVTDKHLNGITSVPLLDIRMAKQRGEFLWMDNYILILPQISFTALLGLQIDFSQSEVANLSMADKQISKDPYLMSSFSPGFSQIERCKNTPCVYRFHSVYRKTYVLNSHLKDLEGDIARWSDQSIWKGSSNEVKKFSLNKEEICNTGGATQDILMLMPSRVSWPDAREACRRFGGRLHIDRSEESVRTRTFPLIAKGEREFPDRCIRVWLGASDIKEEGVWRDSENDKVLDISKFWVDGQPNGVRVQNCAGIWELVSSYQ